MSLFFQPVTSISVEQTHLREADSPDIFISQFNNLSEGTVQKEWAFDITDIYLVFSFLFTLLAGRQTSFFPWVYHLFLFYSQIKLLAYTEIT